MNGAIPVKVDDEAFDVVTGAFGYSGKYLTRILLSEGHRIRTLTNSLERANEFGSRIQAYPYNFDDPNKLANTLHGAHVLYNTYWVRFNHRDFRHEEAVNNTLRLFEAAAKAKVRRVVHVSITNPSEDSPFEYFAGKAKLEKALVKSGLPYSIVRPAVLFGGEDILINNIAWILRRFPVFGVFGNGLYRLQPIHVEDFARVLAQEGKEIGCRTIDAIGPETFSYRGLAETIARAIGKHRPVISVPPWLGFLVARMVGSLVDDVTITREEVGGLMADLLCTNSAPTGTTRLSDWAKEHAPTLGVKYASEMARRRNRKVAYDRL